MTNEQHIENLKKLKSFHNGSYGADIDRAIKALEQEPCEDAISRKNCPIKHISNEDIYIPYLMHKEMDIPISECQKAYNIAMEYLRNKSTLKG